MNLTWISVAVPAPNGISPGSVYGTVIAPPTYTSPTVSISNNAITLDQGQSLTLNGVITGGTAPYAMNVILVSSASHTTIVGDNSFGTSALTWNAVFTTNAIMTSNSPIVANVILTDANPTTVTAGYTTNIIVNPALSSLSTGSSVSIDNGQSYTITATWSGGTANYAVTLFSGSSSTCSSDTTFVAKNTGVSGTSTTFSVSPSSTTSYCIGVSDAATTNAIANQTTASQITVNTAPSVAISPGTQTYDIGQTISQTATVTGGTQSFTFNQLIYNGGSLAYNALYSGINSQSNSISISASTLGTGTFTENVIVKDSSAAGTETFNSVGYTLTINSALLPTIGASNVVIDGSQYLNLTAHTNGGTPSYTYNFIIRGNTGILASNTITSVASNTESWVTQIPNSWAGNSLSVNVIVTDNSLFTANSLSTSLINVQPQFLSTGWTVSNSIVQSGGYETLNSVVTANNPFPYNVAQFNGASSNILIGTPTNLEGLQVPLTISGWFYTTTSSGNQPIYSAYNAPSGGQLWSLVRLDSGVLIYYTSTSSGGFHGIDSGFTPSLNNWHFFTVTVSGSTSSATVTIYLDGNTYASAGQVFTTIPATVPIYIGGDAASSTERFKGAISNIQVYNTSLSAMAVNALYAEGITGSPVAFNNLVGWWDINGNANFNGANVIDFSHSQNMGTPIAVTYASTYNAFTYNDVVYAPNGMVMASQLTTNVPNTYNGLATSSNTFTFSTAGWPTGTYRANTIVTDSATSQSTVTNTLTFTVDSAPSISSWTVSNSLIDLNQYQNANAIVSGGASPYTYNILIYNPSGSLAFNSLANSDSSTSNSFSFQQTGATGAWMANVIITDNDGATATNSIIYGVNSVLSAGAVTPASPQIDAGQSVTLTANPSGGTTSYHYVWYTNSNGNPNCNSANTITGGSNTLSTISVSPGSSTYYTYQVTDSASTPVSVCSGSDEVTVDTALGLPSISTSNSIVDTGQFFTLTGTWSNGVSPFTIKFYNVTGSSTQNTISGATSPSTNTLKAGATTGSDSYNVIVQDSSSAGAETTNSVKVTVTINSAQTANILTETNTVIDSGQSSTLTAGATGGTPSYTFNWFSQANCAGSSFASGVSTTVSPLASNTYSFNSVDSASTANVVCSASNTITVNAAQSLTWTDSKSTIDYGQTQTLTGTGSGGTANFGYNVLVYNAIGSLVYNSLAPSSSSTSNVVAFSQSSAWGTGTFTANIIRTDSATTPTTVTNTLTYTVYASPSTTSWFAFNPTIDIGQTQTLDTVVSGGLSSYTYNFLVYNSIGSLVYNALYTSSSTTNSFSFVQGSTSGTYTANIIITDSDSAVTTNSFHYTVNNALVAGAITPSSPTIDSGQSITLTANPSSGTIPYSYTWYTGASCTSSFGGTASTQSVSPTSTTTYYYKVTDSATTNAVACSPGDAVTVNPTMTITSFTTSNSLINVNQYETINVIISGGTSPYTYAITVYNPSGVQRFSSTDTSTSATSNSFTFQQIGPVGTWSANVVVDDNAYSPNVLNSRITYTVSNLTQSLSFTNPGGNTIVYGPSNTAIANSILSGGTGTYTWAWTVNNVGVTYAALTSSQTSNSAIRNAGTYTYNVVATDTGLTTHYSVTTSNTLVISQNTNPTLTLTLNGTSGNYVIYQHQTIPVNVVSTTSNQLYLYRNGVLVDSANAFSLSYLDTESNSGTVTLEAVANSINYTSTSQTYSLTVNVPSYGATLTPSYIYKLLDGANSLSTSPKLYDLLNYSYALTENSFWPINSITISFGQNTLSGNQLIHIANSMTYATTLWNTYLNNNVVSYNAIVTANDIYGDLLSNTITISATEYGYPFITKPKIYLTSTPQTYTYTVIKTPIASNDEVAGSFPISNTTFDLGENNAVIMSNSTSIAYTYNSPTNSLTINAIVTDINGFSYLNQTTGDQVLAYTYASANRLTPTGYTVKFPYSFQITGGTFSVNSIILSWGDGTPNVQYTFPSPVSSNTITFYHNYSTAGTYQLEVLETDTSPDGGITNQGLTNQILTVDRYIAPTVSVYPYNRFTGAINVTQNYTFYIQGGTFGPKNMTIYWNDAIPGGRGEQTNLVVLANRTNETYVIRHSFPFPVYSYPVNVSICDVEGICTVYPTTINLGNAYTPTNVTPTQQQGINRQQNQTALNTNSTYQASSDPNEGIVAVAIIAAVTVAIGLLVWRHRRKQKAKREQATGRPQALTLSRNLAMAIIAICIFIAVALINLLAPDTLNEEIGLAAIGITVSAWLVVWLLKSFGKKGKR